MAKEISWEIRVTAEELYITEGLTFEQVAKKTDVSVSQLKRWAKEGDWKTKRKEHRLGLLEIKRNYDRLRQGIVEKALNSLDPQDVYAALRIEKLNRETSKSTDEIKIEIDRPKIFLEDLEFIIEVLKEIDPEGLKVLAKSFDTIVARFKESHEKTA